MSQGLLQLSLIGTHSFYTLIPNLVMLKQRQRQIYHSEKVGNA